MTTPNRHDTPTPIPAVTPVTASEWTGLVIAVLVTTVIGLILPVEPDRVTITIHNSTDYRLYIDAYTPDDHPHHPHRPRSRRPRTHLDTRTTHARLRRRQHHRHTQRTHRRDVHNPRRDRQSTQSTTHTHQHAAPMTTE